MFDATVGGLAAAANVFTDGLNNGSLRRYLAFFFFATLTVGIAAFMSGEHAAGQRQPTPVSFVPMVGWLLLMGACLALVLVPRNLPLNLIVMGGGRLIVSVGFICL